MALAKPQRSLRAWTKQKWRTKSGKPSTQGKKATGERYLPEKAIKALSDMQNTQPLRLRREKQLKQENKWLNSHKRLHERRSLIEKSREWERDK
jgi:hypothetical protein